MLNTFLKNFFDKVGADVVITSQDDLRFYLTGFSSSFGYVVIEKDQALFYTDSRYFEAAEKELTNKGINAVLWRPGTTACDLVKGHKKVGVPMERITAPEYLAFIESGYELVDSMPTFKKTMMIKSDEELANLKLACKVADEAFLDLLPQIKEGMSENEVAALLEYLMRMHGASGTSFETIVAFGANGSVPHHETGNTKLKFGDIILIDFGCKVNGYCSDCTRTFLFGNDGEHEEFKTAYNHVLKAHMLVKEQFKLGMTGSEGDAIARNYLKEHELDKYFTHSLGHGIGVNIHEYPTLSPKSDATKFENGMVFSDEPGVYFAGKFGIRIEDTCCFENGKVVSLTNTDKNLIIL